MFPCNLCAHARARRVHIYIYIHMVYYFALLEIIRLELFYKIIFYRANKNEAKNRIIQFEKCSIEYVRCYKLCIDKICKDTK